MDPTDLELKLLARIEREGALTFRDFMEAALYDTQQGYYNTERVKIGAAGDYYTASNVHAAFGAVLAEAFAKLLREVEAPPVLVEMGAGTGQLAEDVLTTLRDEHAEAFAGIRYVIIEKSSAMQCLQRRKLDEFKGQVEWRGLEELGRARLTGVVFSNELVDAMPVHVVRSAGGRLEELYVTARASGQASRLAFAWGCVSTTAITEYLERLNVVTVEGQRLEINLAALRWLEHLGRLMERGYLVTIDYGDTSAHLYGRDRAGGTLRSFYQHRLVDSPLERVGEQDITASVNFTALIEYGRDFGFKQVSYERQAAFLIRMGLIQRIAAMGQAISGEALDLKHRLAVKNLFVPGGASDNFRVLIQSRA